MKTKSVLEGEITSTAKVNGKLLNTKNTIGKINMRLTIEEVETTLNLGLRQGWFSGESDGIKYDMTSGAGVGSRWLIMTCGTRRFRIDMAQFFQGFLTKILKNSAT